MEPLPGILKKGKPMRKAKSPLEKDPKPNKTTI